MPKKLKVIASIVLFKHTHIDLKPTIDSLLSSPSIEKIILVDNGGCNWASNNIHEKIIYLKTSGNFGFGYGHNLAIKKYALLCDLFLICNPDISFKVESFEELINFSLKNVAGLYLPKIIYPNGMNQFGARLLPAPLNLFARRFSKKLANNLDKKYLLKKFQLSSPCFVPNLSGCFMLFKSSCLLELNGFDERFFMYMEDIDLSRRCAEKFGNIYYPFCSIIHRHEQGSYKNIKLFWTHLHSVILYFNKWGWIWDKRKNKLNEKCLNNFKY